MDAPPDFVQRAREHRTTDLEMAAIEQIAPDEIDRHPGMQSPTDSPVGRDVCIHGLLKPCQPAAESAGDVQFNAPRTIER